MTQTDLQLQELEVQRQIQLEKNKIITGRKNYSRAVGTGRKNAEGKLEMEEREEKERQNQGER